MSIDGSLIARAAMALAVLLLGTVATAPQETTVAAVLSPSEGASSWRLLDAKEHPVSDQDLKEKPSVLFFGYTHCPDVCPTALSALSTWIEALGKDAAKLNFAFVTVDPERDKPAALAAYLSYFDPRIRGLTGVPDQVATLARQYGVSYEKYSIAGGDYSMSHPMTFYLIDRNGRKIDSIEVKNTPAEALEKLRRLSRG